MNSVLRISAFLITLLLTVPAPSPAQSASAGYARGNIGPHLAVGSVNGVRLGLRYFLLRTLGLEASGGYVQITLIRENERKEYADGYSATFGGSWYTHPDAPISPMISLLGVYVASGTLPDGFAQTRIALVPSLGSEYHFHEGFSLFFRFGPAFQFTTENNRTQFGTTTQFDGGVSLLF